MKLSGSILAATLMQDAGAQDECAQDGTAFTVECHNDLMIELKGISFIPTPSFQINLSE